MKDLLAELGNPQETFKSIHIAGTSGKGSTTTILSNLLCAHDFKVGTIVSPHILDIRERVQLNNALLSEEKFGRYYFEIEPSINKVNEGYSKSPVTYFEVMVALAYYAFAKEKVDYAVIETGLGGLLDGTNTISRADKLSIITSIGLDHTHILGNTLTKIARQKAGIFNERSRCFSLQLPKRVVQVLQSTADERMATLTIIKNETNYKVHSNGKFDFKYEGLNLEDIELNLHGRYQIENTSLALAALQELALRDEWSTNKNLVYETLRSINFVARFNIIKKGDCTLIIDGAHNPQKMKAFTKSLRALLPDRKFFFFIAFKAGKDISNMLKYITPIAKHIYVSNFFIDKTCTVVESIDPKLVTKELRLFGYKNYSIINPGAICDLICDQTGDFVMTGSLYFISDQLTRHMHLRNKKKHVDLNQELECIKNNS
jgi:dihydrofolate synthase/folylpolyglutamate synthase